MPTGDRRPPDRSRKNTTRVNRGGAVAGGGRSEQVGPTADTHNLDLEPEMEQLSSVDVPQRSPVTRISGVLVQIDLN